MDKALVLLIITEDQEAAIWIWVLDVLPALKTARHNWLYIISFVEYLCEIAHTEAKFLGLIKDVVSRKIKICRMHFKSYSL